MNEYPLRFVAQIVIKADTPLNLSSGENDSLTDSLVATDANGLPMIPGTSLCGVLRHAFAELNNENDASKELKDKTENKIFGYQSEKRNDGYGSRLIVSNAHFVGKDGKAIEAIQKVNWDDKEFYSKFSELPVRQHCKINHKGTTPERGKFDEQVVYKGTKFKFEIELIGNKDDAKNWNVLLNLLAADSFRIGGGTRKGFGKFKIKSCKTIIYDLDNDLDKYLNKSSSLNATVQGEEKIPETNSNKYVKYELNLIPDDFYSFGSGFGDDDVDMTPVYEETIDWTTNPPTFTKKKILIPATSVKGAISHRVAFHYNKLVENFAEEIEDLKTVTEEKNEAVKSLFGCGKGSEADDKGKRGNVIFSDVFIPNKNETKILNHVAIDRFTGGSIDGALFDEKVIYQKDEIKFELLVKSDVLRGENIEQALENTLKDICSGMLPLGGSTMRGHGCFSGSLTKNGEEI